MILNDKSISKFVSFFKKNNCRSIVLLDKKDIYYNVANVKKVYKDVYIINLVNKHQIQISIFIHLNNFENIYLIKNSEGDMYFRSTYLINSTKQIDQIIDNYQKKPTLDGLTKIEKHLDVEMRQLLTYYEISHPEIRYFFLEVLAYPNLHKWTMKNGQFIGIDCEEQMLKEILPFIAEINF